MHCELDVNDWKSCVRQKRTEGSNPSLSDESLVSSMTYGVFAWGDFKGLMGPGFPVDYGYPNDAPVWRGVTPSCV